MIEKRSKPSIRAGDRITVINKHYFVPPGTYRALIPLEMDWGPYYGWTVRGNIKGDSEETHFWISTSPEYSYLPDDFLNKCREALEEIGSWLYNTTGLFSREYTRWLAHQVKADSATDLNFLAER